MRDQKMKDRKMEDLDNEGQIPNGRPHQIVPGMLSGCGFDTYRVRIYEHC